MKQLVYTSLIDDSVYHYSRCPTLDESIYIGFSLNVAKTRGCAPCPICSIVNSPYRINLESLKAIGNRFKIEIVCIENTIYGRTDVGLWKFFWRPDKQEYALYHRSGFDSTMSTENLALGNFHRQSDVKPNEQINSFFYYIREHDKTKKLLAEGRPIPTRTKRQKKYYSQIKKRERKAAVDRLNKLFEEIENSTK